MREAEPERYLPALTPAGISATSSSACPDAARDRMFAAGERFDAIAERLHGGAAGRRSVLGSLKRR